jgi:chromosome partitioning protein
LKLSYEYTKGGKVEKSKANSDLKVPVTIAFAAASGGMGKTSDVYLLCKYLADKGFNVIGIDGDPQANLTLYAGVELNDQDPSMLEFLKGELAPGIPLNPLDAVYETDHDRFSLIATDKGLLSAQSYLANLINPAIVLKKRLQHLWTKAQEEGICYDFCVIDTPPEGYKLSATEIGAADYVVIPALAKSKGLRAIDITLGILDELIDQEAFHGEILGIAPFQDRWVGKNQVKTSQAFFQKLPQVASDLHIFPSVRFDEVLPRLIDEGGSLSDLQPPDLTDEGKYHPTFFFDALFEEIQKKCPTHPRLMQLIA